MIIYNTRNELIESLPKNKIVCEIGVFAGEFSQIILEKNKPAEFHLIDPFIGIVPCGDKDGNNIIHKDLNQEYENVCMLFQNNKNVVIHKDYSFNILNKFAQNYFDIIYIDGDHSERGVTIDLELSYRVIKSNGFITGHDYSPSKFPGVVKAVNDFCENKNLNISALTMDGCPSFMIKCSK